MTQDAISAENTVDEGGRDPKTVVLAGVLAAAVLGAGAYFFLGGGSDSTDLTAAAPPAVTRSVAKTPPSPLPAPAEMPAPATVVGGQNPFKVLYTAPVEKASGSDGASSSGGSGSGSSGSGSGSSGSGSSGSGSSGSGSAGSSPAPSIGTPGVGAPGSTPIALPLPAPVTEQYVLELVSIAPAGGDQVRTTSWIVDGTQVGPVFVGQRFGSYGELVVLALGTDDQGETVLLQVGDAAPRRIHVGEKGAVL